MSQRISLFSAGFCANAPALYYQLKDLEAQQELLADINARAKFDELLSKLGETDEQQRARLEEAARVAEEFEVEVPPLPATGDEYFEWLPSFVIAVENVFPMSRMDHYYFLFGRKISEVLVNLRLACICLEIQARAEKNGLDLSRKTDKCIKDNEYILFKLIAPAALLSSEPRQNFFNMYYRAINGAFEPFRGVEVSTLDRQAMSKLADDLRMFEKEVVKGFHDCEQQLKALEF